MALFSGRAGKVRTEKGFRGAAGGLRPPLPERRLGTGAIRSLRAGPLSGVAARPASCRKPDGLRRQDRRVYGCVAGFRAGAVRGASTGRVVRIWRSAARKRPVSRSAGFTDSRLRGGIFRAVLRMFPHRTCGYADAGAGTVSRQFAADVYEMRYDRMFRARAPGGGFIMWKLPAADLWESFRRRIHSKGRPIGTGWRGAGYFDCLLELYSSLQPPDLRLRPLSLESRMHGLPPCAGPRLSGPLVS